jgi:hypothetical protein
VCIRPLAGRRGLTAADVEAIVAAGRGAMPPGIVEGEPAADGATLAQ